MRWTVTNLALSPRQLRSLFLTVTVYPKSLLCVRVCRFMTLLCLVWLSVSLFSIDKLSTAFAISSVPGKRNSFGKLPPSNSPKVQLQTLVEEEEEEEDETDSTVSSCEDSIESEMHKEESEVQPVADIPKLRAHLKGEGFFLMKYVCCLTLLFKATHRRSLSRDGFFAARWLTDIITTLPISSLQLHYQS